MIFFLLTKHSFALYFICILYVFGSMYFCMIYWEHPKLVDIQIQVETKTNKQQVLENVQSFSLSQLTKLMIFQNLIAFLIIPCSPFLTC